MPTSYEYVLSRLNLYRVKSLKDSLQYLVSYRNTVKWSIDLPAEKEDYLDPLFHAMDSSLSQRKTVRILHFGDSQIESDRITGYIRDTFQKRFGGCGLGFVPIVQPIPSLTYHTEHSGLVYRFTTWEPALTDMHNNYASHMTGFWGPWAQRFYIDGHGSIALRNRLRSNYPGSSPWSVIRLMVQPDTHMFEAKVFVGQNELPLRNRVVGKFIEELTWQTGGRTGQFTMVFEGKRNVYGISLECSAGVVVDNIPMRGAAGTIFRNIPTGLLKEAKTRLNISCILLQYGGNVMPGVHSYEQIQRYCKSIRRQIEHLKNALPDVIIIFIGPSDMGKVIDGKVGTYPFLPELNDSLKKTCLQSGIAYWDMFRAMGGKNSMQRWVAQRLATSDYIHFTHAGTLKIAELFMNALWLEYDIYRLRHKIKKHQSS